MIENFRICFNAVVPIFVYMAVGMAARKAGILSQKDVLIFNKVAFTVFMSVNIFRSIYFADTGTGIDSKLIIFGISGIIASVLAGLAVSAVMLKDKSKWGVMIQGIYRPNCILVGMTIAQALCPEENMSVVAVLIAATTPIIDALAVLILAVFNGQEISAKRISKDIITNPLIIGALSALIFLLLRIRLPKSLETTITAMSNVATPLMLVLLGAFFRFDRLRDNIRLTATAVAFKLVVIPAFTLIPAYLLGFRGIAFTGLIGLFATANAVASFPMAQQSGGDTQLAGDIIVVSNTLSLATMVLWSFLFKTLGAF